MEFITNMKTLTSRFRDCCIKYGHYKWAVAWAGKPADFDIIKLLDKYSNRIEEIVIGTHFCQTSPEFIEKYLHNRKIRYCKNSEGVFHSKVYLFYNTEKDWAAFIGSSNFTRNGFDSNVEANVLISNNDLGCSFEEISDFISDRWKEGEYFDKHELNTYKDTYKFQQKKIRSLKRLKRSKDKHISSILQIMTWDEYFRKILSEDPFYKDRIALLNKAHQIFLKYKSFNSIPLDDQKAISGIIEHSKGITDIDSNWKMFGSMQGAGNFKHEINENTKIGEALNKIPLKGEVTRSQFEKYCDAFSEWKNPIACATRLLAMKRPDLFVCINNKNKKELSRMLNIPQSHFTLNRYWDEILYRIYNSEWFIDNTKKRSDNETSIKKYQVAMLDSISYNYD